MGTYTNRYGNSFALEIEEWTIEAKNYTKRVWQNSVLDFVEYMQLPVYVGGNMPVLTGFLRSSLLCSTSPVAAGTMEKPGGDTMSFDWDPSDVESVILGAKVGQTLYMGYGAVYAGVAEYGGPDRPARGFQRLAVQEWPEILADNIARLR